MIFVQEGKIIDDAMKSLGLNGNYLLSQLIRQLTHRKSKAPSGISTLINDLKPHSDVMKGTTLRLILDSQNLMLKNISDKIKKIGRGKQILNPKFPDEETLAILIARLFAMIGSDGTIDKDYRVSYYEKVALRRERACSLIQVLGDIRCRVLKKDGSECGLVFPNIIGRLLARFGMPVGGKVLQGVRVPEFILNGSPEIQLAYLEELIPEEGWVTIDQEDNIRIGWSRTVVLFDEGKGGKYNFKQLISKELVKFIERHGTPYTRKYPSGVIEVYYRLTMGTLQEIMTSKNQEDATNAALLDQIVRENPSLYIEDEKQLGAMNGIMTSEQCPCEIRRSISSNRVSVKWTVKASSEEDVILWGILASPNDRRKKERLNSWMKRHPKKVMAVRRKLEHSMREMQRIRNMFSNASNNAAADDKENSGE